MARGWESKEVESQIEAAEARERERQQPQLTAEQRELKSKRDSLLLDRKRIETELARARHPRHQQMLRDALSHLDAKLTELE